MWDRPAVLLPHEYLTAIQDAGGLALMVPPDPHLADDPDELLELLDGLVLAGGADMDPSSYGADPDEKTNSTSLERDRLELALIRRAVEEDLPTLGICRGMQVLNVAFGGTLHQHLPDEVGHEDHRRAAGTFENSDHDVRLTEGSLAARAAGELLHGTKSHHHQGVSTLGDGLEVTGISVLDDLPEAIEIPGKRFVLGVQWHPEADEESRVIRMLVAEAARRSRRP
jgi:putative glutamine amidotransferase